MSMEQHLDAHLRALCPHVHPDIAPPGTPRPYVTWQALGGEVARFLDNSAADKRNTLMQINAWATTRMQATTLIRAIEDALADSPHFVARPQGEALSTHEPATGLYGSIQRFSIWAAR
jgi:hypothetical protein